MRRLTTHVLDTARGRPAAGVDVLALREQDGGRELVARACTNADGRTDAPLLAGDALAPGRYELLFAIGAYFAAAGLELAEPPFLDRVPVRFAVDAERSHYHVPLLCTPWSYATYLGADVVVADERRAQLALARAERLAAISEQPGRITRRLATSAWREAGEQVLAWMEQAGMRARRDAIGNVIGRYEGHEAGAPALLLGSHLDTVPDAGRYDGVLGVLAGLAVVEALHARAERLPCALVVCGFADEEGARFGTTLLGSRALTGALDPSDLARTDAEGIALATALALGGGEPDALAGARLADPLGYLELHIEQGPVLERHDRPLGVVTAIAGQTRMRIALAGRAGHAGTVPMDARRDALCGAAELTLAVEALARETPGLVATVGELAPSPGSANVIPGAAALSVDLRHEDDAARRRAADAVRVRAGAIAQARELVVERVDTLVDHDATRCDEAFAAALEDAVAAAGAEPLRLASGAGHDAVALAAICPVGMLFVRCAGGVSHHPDESVRTDDVALALDALERAVRALAEAIA